MEQSDIIYNILAFIFIIKTIVMIYLNLKLKDNKK